MNPTVLIKRFVLVVIVLTLASLVYTLMTSSTIEVRITPDVPATATEVMVDGKKIFPKGSSLVYSGKVGFGSHTITVSSVGYTTHTTKTSTTVRSTVSVPVNLVKADAQSTASKEFAADGKIKVSGAQYFGSDDWMVFSSSDISGGEDGSIVVSQYQYDKNEWEVVAEGTDIDLGDPALSQAPAELFDYLRGRL